MSRNEDRVGSPQQDAEIPSAIQNEKSNSDFNWKLPTEIVELPSKGKYYNKSHPLSNVSEVEIKFMSTEQEDILNNKSYLKKGTAIDKMIQSILVDQSIKVEDMLVGDKNALIIAARVNGFGKSYKTNVKCPVCEESFEHDFDLSEIKSEEGNPEEYGATISEEGIVEMVLPKSEVVLRCKMMDGNDEKKYNQLLQSKKKNNLPDTPMTDQLRMLIVSVNGDTNRSTIEKFIRIMPSLDIRYFRKTYSKCIPHVDMEQKVLCPNEDCEEVREITVPFSPTFFWT